MARKSIALALLIGITAWAELALAPMLAMHAGHMRPGHEMAADMPHAGHHHRAPNGNGQAETQMPCCPGLHRPRVAIVLEVAAAMHGCDDPHSCCFRQGPQSVPAPASDVQKLSSELARAEIIEARVVLPRVAPIAADSTPAFSPSADVLGMILRV